MKISTRQTQRQRILALLRQAEGRWVPLPEILTLGVAQYSARILELRRLGYAIENRLERSDGECLSWFRLPTAKEPPRPRREPNPRALPVKDGEHGDWFRGKRPTGLPLWDGLE